MSYKTDKLIELLPDVYDAIDGESLMYKLLDTVGAELMVADQAVKRLLKSHWVDYAEAKGLDGLGQIFGVNRRRLGSGADESDDAFRLRLKSIVQLFTGGGTKKAVIGAVRSALGLPYDLGPLRRRATVPTALIEDIERLVYIEEFSPEGERIVHGVVSKLDRFSQIEASIDIRTVRGNHPVIKWRITSGVARRLSAELLPEDEEGEAEGVRSVDSFRIEPGNTLVLSARSDGTLVAFIGANDVSGSFTNLDGSTPAFLPQVPVRRSEWRFRAHSAVFDSAVFGTDSFDLPDFQIEMNWLRFTPLTFDVYVPYFLQRSVDDLKALYEFQGELFIFEGLPRESIPLVVDQTRAAGVRGSVQFFLNFYEVQEQAESLRMAGLERIEEDAGAQERLLASSVGEIDDSHDVSEALILGAVFDVSRFDQGHGFAE